MTRSSKRVGSLNIGKILEAEIYLGERPSAYTSTRESRGQDADTEIPDRPRKKVNIRRKGGQ
jgi:hypothetical protein